MKIKREKGDIVIPIVVAAIASFGVVAVYSASRYICEEDYGNGFYFALKQLIGFFGGLIAMFLTMHFDYKKYFKVAKWLYLCGLLLLALVFVPGLGVRVYGAARWINLRLFTVQPSEIARLFLVIFLAAYFAENPKRAKSFKGVLIPVLSSLACAVLIMSEPNMSVTVCVAATVFVILFAAGVRLKTFLVLLVPVLALIPFLIISEPYRLKRLVAFLNPWASPKGEGYQLIQSLYGLGNGGFFGSGLFSSRQKYRFLPFSESDFILSVIGEELGFIGVIALLFVSLLLAYRGIKAAKGAPDMFGYLLAVGISSSFFIQVIVNALVVSGSVPPTGIPFPLVSSGNTSLLVNMAAFGILYNVSSQSAPSSRSSLFAA